MAIILKARFRNLKHKFVVQPDDSVYTVRDEIARAFELPNYCVQMKISFPPKEFSWNSKTKVQEIFGENAMIVVQEGSSNMAPDPYSDSEEDENASASDSGLSHTQDTLGSVSKSLWRIASFKDWGLEEDEWGSQFEVVWHNLPHLSAEMLKSLMENRLRSKRLDSRSSYLDEILDDEKFASLFEHAKSISEILSSFFQMQYYYSDEVASNIAFIVASFYGAPEYLKTLSESERLTVHFNEMVDARPLLLQQKYENAGLSREEMMDTILKNCAISADCTPNAQKFLDKLRERCSVVVSPTDQKKRDLDMIQFLKDHGLCVCPTGTLLAEFKKHVIQLSILPIPEEKKEEEEEVSTWTCECGWDNELDALTCYICQKPNPDQETDDTKVDASTSESDPKKNYSPGIIANNLSVDNSGSSSGDITHSSVSLINASPPVQTSTSSPASTSNTSNVSNSTDPLVQTTNTSVIQVSNDSEVVPFSQFVNAYVMKNLGSDSVDRLRADARSFYDIMKNDPSTLLETFQSFQL
jgi:hypothetical protein